MRVGSDDDDAAEPCERRQGVPIARSLPSRRRAPANAQPHLGRTVMGAYTRSRTQARAATLLSKGGIHTVGEHTRGPEARRPRERARRAACGLWPPRPGRASARSPERNRGGTRPRHTAHPCMSAHRSTPRARAGAGAERGDARAQAQVHAVRQPLWRLRRAHWPAVRQQDGHVVAKVRPRFTYCSLYTVYCMRVYISYDPDTEPGPACQRAHATPERGGAARAPPPRQSASPTQRGFEFTPITYIT